MTAWLPLVKTILPYLTTIVTAAVPAFTVRKDNEKSAQVMAQQIAELQEAVRANAESVKVLAEQMQRAVQAIEASALASERALARTRTLSIAALVVAGVALVSVLLLLLLR